MKGWGSSMRWVFTKRLKRRDDPIQFVLSPCFVRFKELHCQSPSRFRPGCACCLHTVSPYPTLPCSPSAKHLSSVRVLSHVPFQSKAAPEACISRPLAPSAQSRPRNLATNFDREPQGLVHINPPLIVNAPRCLPRL